MKKIILAIILLSVSLFAQLTNRYISTEFMNKDIPIIDIRTPQEWKETGVLKNAIPIMFFDQRGAYNAKKFLTELNHKIDTGKPFALICHTGNRTSIVSSWLAKDFNYNVINLKGGMQYATQIAHLKTVPYKKQ